MSSFFSSRHLGRLSGFGVLALLLIAGCGDGDDGQTPIIQTADADDCPEGGTVITTGYADDDGQISDVIDEVVICDGVTGETGDDGATGDDGEDGGDSIVATSTEDPGDNCEEGGVRIDSGFDTTGDGDIDDIVETNYLCNLGQCSTGQPLDIDIHTDDLPDQFVDGFSYEIGVTVNGETPDNLALTALNAGINDVEVEATFDEDEGHIVLTHIEGEGPTSLALITSDGCDTASQTITFGPFEEGLADVVVGHLFPGAGEVAIWDVDADMDEDDPIAELEDFEFSDPVEVPWGTYEFEIFDGDDESLGTTGDIDIEPFSTNLVYAYSDGDGVGVNAFDIDDPDVDDGEFSLRAHHLADGVGTVDIYAVVSDGESLLFDDVAFEDVSDPTAFDASIEAAAGIDSDQDGEPDLVYTSTAGAFVDGAHLEAFAVYSEDDVVKLVTYDHGSNVAIVHDYRIQTFSSSPQLDIEPNGEVTDTISVSDCGTVAGITMDIEIFTGWRGDLTVYLEDPSGDEIPLKSRFGSSTDDIIGNFNDTLQPEAGFSGVDGVEPISYFEDASADGDWTLRVDDETSFDDDTSLESWALNIVCD